MRSKEIYWFLKWTRITRAFTALIILFFYCLPGFSQSNIRINNYWENTYYINPASIYGEYNFVLSGVGRKQWINFPGAPQTFFTTFTAYSDHLNTQLGLKFFSDKIGYTSLKNLSLSYSYSVKLDDAHKLNLGVSGNVQDVLYDMNEANTETIGDPVVYANQNKMTNFNADVGFELVGRYFLIGASSQNLLSLFNEDNKLQTNTSFLYGSYNMLSEQPVRLRTGITFIKNEALNQLEFNLSSYFSFHRHPDLFQLGALYRTNNEIAALFSIDLISSVRLAYSYDFFIGDIRRSSYGSQEIMLIWKFSEIPGCATCYKLFK